MISRVAEGCFWLARYVERVDTLARLLEVNVDFDLDAHLPGGEVWRPLIIVVGQEEDFVERLGEAKLDDAATVLDYLTWDSQHPSSIFSSLRAGRENARIVREVISVEMWEAINDTWLWLKSRSAKRLYERERDRFYQQLSNQCMLYHGISYSTMLHDEPFVFMKLGRAMERMGQTARILDVKHHNLGDKPRDEESPLDNVQWLAILRSCSGVDPFFQHASNVLSGPAVAGFLILDSTFPRSVLHNLDRARGLMWRLREADPRPMHRRSWELLERFRGSLLQMEIEDIQRMGVHECLTWIVDTTAELCGAIHADYLDPPLETLRRSLRAPAEAGDASP